MPNRVDCAVARLDETLSYNGHLPKIGEISGHGRAQVNSVVSKFGNATGYSEGFVKGSSLHRGGWP